MRLLPLDELSENRRRSMPYDKYFGEMRLTKAQIRKRVNVAIELEDAVETFFETLISAYGFGLLDMTVPSAKEDLERAYIEAMTDVTDPDEHLLEHAEEYVDNIAKNTVKAIRKIDAAERNRTPDSSTEPERITVTRNGNSDDARIDDQNKQDNSEEWIPALWYLSEDRAIYNAENEANIILNHSEFEDALRAGYTRKQWLSMRDSRVRDTHREVDGKILYLDEYFEVGSDLMLYPGDTENGSPEETSGCRCSLRYLP